MTPSKAQRPVRAYRDEFKVQVEPLRLCAPSTWLRACFAGEIFVCSVGARSSLNMALLELRDISKRFGGLQALSRVSMRIEEGMIASLIGPNGAGKTTLFNTLTGLYHPDERRDSFSGSFTGRTEAGADHRRRDQPNVSEYSAVFGHMSVLDNVLVGMHSRLANRLGGYFFGDEEFSQHVKEAAHQRAQELIELTGLGGRENEWAQQLSYGEQRRLEIARALAAAPQLLLLDEPTAGMNASEAQSLMALFKELHRAPRQSDSTDRA